MSPVGILWLPMLQSKNWCLLFLSMSNYNSRFLYLQKDLLLSQTVIDCLEILLGYLHSKNESIGIVFLSLIINMLLCLHFLQ